MLLSRLNYVLRIKKVIPKFIKFLISGLLGYAIEICFFLLFLHIFSLHYFISSLFGDIISIVFEFFLFSLFVYKPKIFGLLKLKKYLLVVFFLILIDNLCLIISIEIFNSSDLIGKMVGLIVSGSFNFTSNLMFTFKEENKYDFE